MDSLFPLGPSPVQVLRDRNCSAIAVLTTMLVICRGKLRFATRNLLSNRSHQSKEELESTKHACLCEIEALETALEVLQEREALWDKPASALE